MIDDGAPSVTLGNHIITHYYQWAWERGGSDQSYYVRESIYGFYIS